MVASSFASPAVCPLSTDSSIVHARLARPAEADERASSPRGIGASCGEAGVRLFDMATWRSPSRRSFQPLGGGRVEAWAKRPRRHPSYQLLRGVLAVWSPHQKQPKDVARLFSGFVSAFTTFVLCLHHARVGFYLEFSWKKNKAKPPRATTEHALVGQAAGSVVVWGARRRIHYFVFGQALGRSLVGSNGRVITVAQHLAFS